MTEEKTKVVILCGGKGTRLREETEFIPKPLVRIGGMPIIWHIMKLYAHHGYKDFVFCLGYKGEMIKEYFLNYEWMSNDFTLNLKDRKEWVTHYEHEMEDWTVTFSDTGQETKTGGRVKKIRKYVKDCDNFMVTYGDGVADANIKKLMQFHKKHGKTGTITALHPVSKYGIIGTDGGHNVTYFKEKPQLADLINGGFMVFKQSVFDYLRGDHMLVDKPLPEMAHDKQLSVYKHDGFWHCMDTYKDYQSLNELWEAAAPWKIWGGK